MTENSSNSVPETVGISVLAEILEVTDRQARNLLSDAGVKPTSRGKWPFAMSVRSILQHARKSREDSELSKAKAREINARARRHELSMAKAERELIPLEDFEVAFDEVLAAMRSEFVGLPARLTRDRTERTRFNGEVHASMARIAAKLKDRADMLRGGEVENDD
ncbi:hypothetical protein SIAM614_03660 [Roseibium aggregatum IAM 12614]|uniref:Phage terminase Nu1 subunit (DNA packaging protein) n=1 Tax=Roseibium aggregatum (strain ATCC 25650 / DSM 13394 / JCM 20685 / NBRC 16684 / NCIMB 2208 / IAM 12614 / B1) TaxID=384765 RepID=A0NRU5_ROSAI|nr:hypothetical protein [Roseibium aggregatum]EAV44224.1 hypothetical protein SIAM614_03660 [Roseibium aggregatum IAM 12614]